jgi:Tol biopolymer transport system component
MNSGSFFRRPAVLLALALCSVGGVVTILGRLASGPPAAQKRVVLSKEAGTKAYPAFAPDGQRVAYSARDGSKVEPFHIYIRTVTADTPRQLTSGPGNDVGPVWSPDGTKIAFQRLEEGRTAYIVTGADGGNEQRVAEFAAEVDEAQPLPAVTWAPDGRSLVVVQVSEKQLPFLALVPAGGGEPKRITNPPQGSEGDSTPAVSPDGTTLAFVRSSGPEGADIFLCDLSGGALRRLTFDDRAIRGISWTRDSHDLVYSANRFGGAWRLWRVPAYGGAPRPIDITGRHAVLPAVAPAGNLLAYTDSPTVSSIWRAVLSDSQAAPEERPLIRSNGRETSPAYSPDGQKIADISDQTGSDEVWMSDAEGRNRVQVTHFDGPQVRHPQWSADSKQIIFDTSGDQGSEIYAVAAVAGARPKRLLAGGSGAVFSGDGKHIFYQSHGQVWKATADGGGVGRRQDRVLPFAPGDLAGSGGGRRGRRSVRPRPRPVLERYTGGEQRDLLSGIRAQHPRHGDLVLRFRGEERIGRVSPARRQQFLSVARRKIHSLSQSGPERNQSDAAGELPLGLRAQPRTASSTVG